jgi:hypothetical protein
MADLACAVLVEAKPKVLSTSGGGSCNGWLSEGGLLINLVVGGFYLLFMRGPGKKTEDEPI